MAITLTDVVKKIIFCDKMLTNVADDDKDNVNLKV